MHAKEASPPCVFQHLPPNVERVEVEVPGEINLSAKSLERLPRSLKFLRLPPHSRRFFPSELAAFEHIPEELLDWNQNQAAKYRSDAEWYREKQPGIDPLIL